jgi:hypothetical protein
MISSPDCAFSMSRDRVVLAVWIFTCTSLI